MAKITMKERVLQFVEYKGSASHTEIIRFIVDYKNGDGTFDANKHAAKVSKWKRNEDGSYTEKIVPANPYRGYYSSAFCVDSGYFLFGKTRLIKTSKGYEVVRDQK